jgi:hypothetical protein
MVDRIDRASKDFDSAAAASATRLDDAHRKFSKHVETANTYLADQLATAAGSIDERLENISLQMTGKLEMTSSRISDRLGDVSGLVERSVDKFNNEMERVLTGRKQALDTLIADAAKRAGEIDAVMTSYMNMIEDSLAASEARAKEISRIVADQSNVAVRNLEEELKRLESSSGGQISQASRILREQHERAMASMNEMLSSTASDFQQTAQDMRLTAQQVVKDIDAARNELKRAIFDLPEETRSNADAMRRVVADQIAALNALADVVKRQTGTVDLSGPGVSLRRSGEPPLGKSEGAASEAPQSRLAGAQNIQSERVEPVSEPAAATPRTVTPALPKAMDSLVSKLNDAARDLVEALDGTLPRDLEKAYAQGSRDVYSRRLYESRSKNFERTLASRYGSDRLVRARIDAYVRLFERLLDTVAESPKGDRLVEACLASESGRIYVMLAEATGRIPQQ